MRKVGVAGTAKVYLALRIQCLWALRCTVVATTGNARALVAAGGHLALPIVPTSAWWCYSWYGPCGSARMLGLAQTSCNVAADRLVCLS